MRNNGARIAFFDDLRSHTLIRSSTTSRMARFPDREKQPSEADDATGERSPRYVSLRGPSYYSVLGRVPRTDHVRDDDDGDKNGDRERLSPTERHFGKILGSDQPRGARRLSRIYFNL